MCYMLSLKSYQPFTMTQPKEKAGDLSKEETDERMGINALVLFFSFAFTVGCLAALTSF